MRILPLLLAFVFSVFSTYSANADPGAPPTNIRKDGPAAMTPKQAKLALGFPDILAQSFFDTGAKFVFTIIDMGFVGLGDWMAAHPDMKGRIHYQNMKTSKKSKTQTHGFDVFRTALSVMPNAEFILLETGGDEPSISRSLDYMKTKGSYYASMSIATKAYIGEWDGKADWLSKLNEHQITLFVGAGNWRQINHFFPYQDSNNNGFIEFNDGASLTEDNKFYIRKGRKPAFNLTWNEWPKRSSNFELQLLKDGKIVASANPNPRSKQPLINLNNYTAEEKGYYTLRIKTWKPVNQDQLKFAFFASGVGTSKGIFNGLQSLGLKSQIESPFLITVGAFGLDVGGKVEPSLFSSLGRTNKGEYSPHILGPGQLEIDGEVLNGTSFATPYIAALYSIYADYNIKNMIEATSGFGVYKTGLTPMEKSRWGVPMFSKIFNNSCKNSNKIESFRHQFRDDKLVLNFDFSRNCMEKLDYWLHVTFKGEGHISSNLVTSLDITTKNNKGAQVPLKGWVSKYSAGRNIDKEPVTIEVPMKYFSRINMGKEIIPTFYISTKAQWEAKPFVDDVQPKTPIMLPQSAPVPANIVGLDAINMAVQANTTGAYREAVELSSRAFSDNSLTYEQRLMAYEVLSTSYISQSNMTGLIDTANAAMEDGHAPAQFLLNRGMASLAMGDPAKAKADFETCIEPATSSKQLPCSVGLLLVQAHLGQQSFDAVMNLFGDKIKDMPNTRDIHAQVFAMYLGAFKSDQLEARAQKIGKDRTATVLSLTTAYYYLGQVALLNNDPELARKMFERSSVSGGVNLERALARHWLNPQLAEVQPVKKSTPTIKEIALVTAGEKQSSTTDLNVFALVMDGLNQDSAMAKEVIAMVTAAFDAGEKGEIQLSDKDKNEAYSALAYAHLLNGDIAKSLEASQMGTPTMIDSYVVKGLAQLLLDQKVEAVKTFTSCLEKVVGNPVNASCEIWRIISVSYGGTDVSAQASPEAVAHIKKVEGISLLATNTALLLFSAKESFHNVIEKEKLTSGGDEEAVSYSHDLSFYLGMWAFLHGLNDMALGFFQDAAEGTVQTPERAYSRLLLAKLQS